MDNSRRRKEKIAINRIAMIEVISDKQVQIGEKFRRLVEIKTECQKMSLEVEYLEKMREKELIQKDLELRWKEESYLLDLEQKRLNLELKRLEVEQKRREIFKEPPKPLTEEEEAEKAIKNDELLYKIRMSYLKNIMDYELKLKKLDKELEEEGYSEEERREILDRIDRRLFEREGEM